MRTCSVMARYSTALAREELEAPAAIGRHAAQRALARMRPRSLTTGEYPVLFSAEVARSLIGHLLSAVSGGTLYRRASFLQDSVGTRLFPDWFAIDERPHLRRGLRSAAFDAEGVAPASRRWCAMACCSAISGQLFGAQAGPADHRQCWWRA